MSNVVVRFSRQGRLMLAVGHSVRMRVEVLKRSPEGQGEAGLFGLAETKK